MRHRNMVGGPWSPEEVKDRALQSHRDNLLRQEGKPAGGYYWVVREKEVDSALQGGTKCHRAPSRILVIAGLHRRGKPWTTYIHRTYLRPDISPETTVSVVQETVRLFARLNPEEKVVIATSPNPQLYQAAGFQFLSETVIRRRNNRLKRMCLLAADLASLAP